jgi:hypothetical protein
MHGTLAELHSGDSAHREATAQAVSRLFQAELPGTQSGRPRVLAGHLPSA